MQIPQINQTSPYKPHRSHKHLVVEDCAPSAETESLVILINFKDYKHVRHTALSTNEQIASTLGIFGVGTQMISELFSMYPMDEGILSVAFFYKGYQRRIATPYTTIIPKMLFVATLKDILTALAGDLNEYINGLEITDSIVSISSSTPLFSPEQNLPKFTDQICKFVVKDKVKKVGGDYTFVGTVVAVFPKTTGAIRLVVEDDRGILHIYSSKNLDYV